MSGRDSGNAPPSTPVARHGDGARRRGITSWLAVGVLLAGCSDDAPTGPSSAPTPARPVAVAAEPITPVGPPSVLVPPGQGVILLRRTTSAGVDAKTRTRAVRHETWKVPQSAVTKRSGVMTLRARAEGEPTAAAIAKLPPTAVLQFPALAASAVCANAPAWKRQRQVGTLTVITRGQGDEPWSTMETWSGGQIVSRSRSVWERRRGSWQLLSHEDVAAVGGGSTTLTVDRAGFQRSLRDLAVPRVQCADRSANIVAEVVSGATLGAGASTAWSAGLGPVGLARMELTGALQTAAETCTPSDEEAEVACSVLLVATIGAGAAVVGAAAAVYATCVTPAVFVVAPCISAVSTLTAVSAALAVAEHAYDECKAKARTPVPCSCPATDPLAPTAAQLTGARISAATLDGTARPLAARLDAPQWAIDCGTPLPPTGGGGGGTGGEGGNGGGSGGYWVEICSYTDHYDDDGNYTHTVRHSCRIELMQ